MAVSLRMFPHASYFPTLIRAGLLTTCLCLMAVLLHAQPQQASVVGAFPRDGATGLLRNLFISVKLEFPRKDQRIDQSTFTGENVRLYPSGSPLTQVDSWLFSSDETKNITLQPKGILSPATTFVFEITSSLLDDQGVPFKPFRTTFRTGTQGLDKPVTTPPGYSTEPREFAFDPGEGAQPVTPEEPEPEEEPEAVEIEEEDQLVEIEYIAPPVDYTDEIKEANKVMDVFDADAEPDEDFLIDITDMLEEEELVEEVPQYWAEEEELADADLLVDFEEDEELEPDLEEYVLEDLSVPEVVLSAPVGRGAGEKADDEGGMDTPDLLSLNLEEADSDESDLEAEAAKALFEPEEEGEEQPTPNFGYLLPADRRLSRPKPGKVEPEKIAKTEFLDFEVEFKEEGFVELRWEMESEMNNRYFSMERSADGRNFARFDTLNSLSNGKQALRYLQNDTKAPLGTNFYRVAYHTKSGEKGYSDIREVFVPEKEHIKFGKLAVFRNAPLPLEFKLNERRNVTILILTEKGGEVKKVSELMGPGLVQHSLDMQGIPPGAYLARIDASSIRTQRRVVVLR